MDEEILSIVAALEEFETCSLAQTYMFLLTKRLDV